MNASVSSSFLRDLITPQSADQIIDAFHEEHGSINKHLLTLYSLVIGLQAKRVVELGMGYTTGVLRSALQKTGGELFSCDWDQEKWQEVGLSEADEHFHPYFTDSKSFLNAMQGPFDFVLHDAAHDLWQAAWDLEHIWPMMRQHGVICVHDTQHSLLGRQMHEALKKAFHDCPVSWTHLPFGYGLTIIRIEKEQPFDPIQTSWHKEGYEGRTLNETCGMIHFNHSSNPKTGLKERLFDFLRLLRWKIKA